MYVAYINVLNILLDLNLLNVGQLHVYCGKKAGKWHDVLYIKPYLKALVAG